MENFGFGNKCDEVYGMKIILIKDFFLLHKVFLGAVFFSFAFLLQLKDHRAYRFIIKI